MTSEATFQDVARRAAHCLFHYQWKLWFWGDSIGLEGLLDASALTGDAAYFAYVHGLLKGWLPRIETRSAFDYTAAGVALLRVYEQTGNRDLLEGAYRHARYMAGFRKTKHGAYMRYEDAAIELPPELPLEHPDSESVRRARVAVRNGGPCVFVDSVHFDGPFFAKLYHLTGERQFRELALDNILPQIELLYDRNERLFHHFWIETSGQPNGVLWARGNGWGLLGVVHTLEWIGADATDAEPLREVLRQSLPRLRDLQDESGTWHTILDDPESYVESSTAAFYVDVLCRAARLAVIPLDDYRDTVDRAVGYLLRHVRSDGVLDGVSFETFPSTRAQHYRDMPRGSMSPWGQGPLLTALLSYSGSTKKFAAARLRAKEEIRAIG